MFTDKDPSLKSYLIQVALNSLGYNAGTADNWWGTKTENAYQMFISHMGRKILIGDGTWPFTVNVEGSDLIVENIMITCFGGGDDPQDRGETASGVNTKLNPNILGVSLPMDGRAFHMSEAEHKALDGSPIPKIPWHTLVEVTIGGKTIVPDDGVIDLGPGKQASYPNEPHALDLTVAAAKLFNSGANARNFEARGSFRIMGGARYI